MPKHPFVPKRITSTTNETIKAIDRLHMRKHRTRTRQFIAEGLRTVIQACELGLAPRIVLLGDDTARHEQMQNVVDACRKAGGECLQVTRELLEKLSGRDNPQTVIAVFDQRWERLNDLRLDGDSVWTVLESVRDPGNLGTILRTSDAAGATGVILLDQTCDPFSLEAVRASMGSVFAQRLIRASSEEFLAWRARQKATLIGTSLGARKDYRHARYARPLLLMMGNEQSGLPPRLTAACDLLVKIPMRGSADSLNLAVATSLVLYEALNQNRVLHQPTPA